MATDASPAVDAAVATPAAPEAAAPDGPAEWTRGPAPEGIWIRSAGLHAPPLVVRGVVVPTSPDDLATCEGFQGARFGTPSLRLRIDGAPRTLHVWGRARGPLGLVVAPRSPEAKGAIARAGAWAKLDVESVAGEVFVDIADVDVAGERRGQTSPYVVVVRDDEAAPAEEPDERAPLGPDVVTVRWSLTPTSCPEGMDGWSCARAALQLRGAVRRDVPLKPLLLGQSGCWPQGTGVYCAGASGGSSVSLSMAANGSVEVGEYSASDGYCEPDAECGSTSSWATFRLRPGLRLAPDPAGTFPPSR